MPIYVDIPFPTFQPAVRLVTFITNANPALIGTNIAHQYVTGTIVRLHIPLGCGMRQADGLTGTIRVIDPMIFFINIDTTQFDPLTSTTGVQVIPIGEVASMLTAAKQNVLPY